MKIFIIGMPQSGRTTLAKALCQDGKYHYIDASSWVKHTFRDPKPDEHPQQYHDEYHHWFTNRLKINPWMCVDEVLDSMKAYHDEGGNFVIDSVVSPKDFTHLFDFNKDFAIFLNRTDSEIEYKDYESIGVSVMRDYCFWLSSAGLLPKDRWFEYNFKIPGEDTDFIKSLGSKNSVFIVRSINRAISHLKEILLNLQDHQF